MFELLKNTVFVAAWGSAVAWAQVPAELLLDVQQKAALGVRVAPVQAAQAGALLASATVTVPPGREVTVAAPYAGVITRIQVGLGDAVKAGSVLAQWSSPQLADARRQMREAQLDAQNAQAALARDQAMLADGIIPAARLQISQNKFQAAQAALQAKQAELRSSGAGAGGADYAGASLTSPLDGRLVQSLVTVGQRVEAGMPLFKVADTRQLQLDLLLSPEKAAQLKVGDAVSVPSRQAKAVLVGVSRAVDATQQAQARARVTEAGSLSAGEVLPVQVHPALASTQAAWQVPARAVVTHQLQSWVFVGSATGFVPTPVKVLSSNDEQSVVTGALSDKHQVAVSGLASLRALLQKGQ
ncbi:MAG: efflux RND transporter periplasmic adaptor subunit [Limnohabitans sp.]